MRNANKEITESISRNVGSKSNFRPTDSSICAIVYGLYLTYLIKFNRNEAENEIVFDRKTNGKRK